MKKKLTIFFLEIPIFFAVVASFNHFVIPEFPGFIGIDPHPYWIGILIFSLSYGAYVGLTAALISIGLYFANAWLFLERYLFEDPTFYLLPFFFLLVSILMGEISRKYRKTIEVLKKEKEEREQNIQKLEEEIQTLWKIKYELEQKVVTQVSTVTTLYEGAKSLESTDPENILKSILLFFSRVLETEESAIYTKNEDGWHLKESHGWKEYHKRPTKIGLTDGVIGLSGSQNKIVSIRDFVEKHDHEIKIPNILGDAIIAGPIRKGERGEVVAVFAIQKIPFLKLNSASLLLLTFLLSWASRAVGRLSYLKELESDAIREPKYNIFTYRYFLTRADQEFELSQNYGIPVRIGLVKIAKIDSLSNHQKEALLSLVSEIITSCCKKNDVVAMSEESGIDFCFMLIAASDEETSVIKDKIMTSYESVRQSQPDTWLNEHPLMIHIVKIDGRYSNIHKLLREEKKRIQA